MIMDSEWCSWWVVVVMGDTYQLTAVATTAPCSSMTGPLTLSLRIHCRINIIAEPPATGCCFQTGLKEDSSPRSPNVSVCVCLSVTLATTVQDFWRTSTGLLRDFWRTSEGLLQDFWRTLDFIIYKIFTSRRPQVFKTCLLSTVRHKTTLQI